MWINMSVMHILPRMMHGLIAVFLFLQMISQSVSGEAYTGKPSLSLKVSPMESQSGYAPSFGAEIRLQCHITAHPHIDAKNTVWKFSDSVLHTGNKYTLYKMPQMGSVEEVTMILTIHHINDKDLGNYTCDAKNSDGMYKHATIQIKPMGRNDIDFEVYTEEPPIGTHGRGRIGGPAENKDKDITTIKNVPSNGVEDIRTINIGLITVGMIVFYMF